MSATNGLTLAFEGDVRCERSAAGKDVRLHGRSRLGNSPACETDLLCRDASLPALPERMTDLSVRELGSPLQSPRRFELRSTQLQLQFSARSIQLQRAAGSRMFTAVRAVPVPRSLRAGWWLLLSVLRIPGVGRLLLTTRGER